MIKKTKENEWTLFNHDGTKVLGKFRSEEEAMKREKQINYFRYLSNHPALKKTK